MMDTDPDGVEQTEVGSSWVRDPSKEELLEAVRDRLEGKKEKRPDSGTYLHRAVGRFVKDSLCYKKRKKAIIKRVLGSRLSIK